MFLEKEFQFCGHRNIFKLKEFLINLLIFHNNFLNLKILNKKSILIL